MKEFSTCVVTWFHHDWLKSFTLSLNDFITALKRPTIWKSDTWFLNFVTVYVQRNVFKENNGSSFGVAMLSPLQILFIPFSLNFQFCRQYHILFLLIFIALVAFFYIKCWKGSWGKYCPFQLFFLLFFLMKHFKYLEYTHLA